MARLPLVLRIFLMNRYLCLISVCGLMAMLVLLIPIVGALLRGELSTAEIAAPCFVITIALAIFYGLVRGWCFHPAFDSDYHDWLSCTAWTPSHPLPKGPLHLVRTDVAVVGTLCLAAFVAIWPINSLYDEPDGLVGLEPLVAFFLALSIVWTLANGFTGQLAVVYTTLWVPVVFGLLKMPPIGFVGCPFLMAGIAWLGVRRSLKTFPWNENKLSDLLKGSSKQSTPVLGWPYSLQLEKQTEIRTTSQRAFLEALLVAGWTWFVMGITVEPTDTPILRAGVPVLIMLFGISRLLSYSPVLCAHLCWGLRIARRKWFLPRHDQIFIAPILMIFLGWTLPTMLASRLNLSIETSSALTVGLVYCIARAMGPSIRELQFTGIHSKFDAPLLQRRVFAGSAGKR